MKNKNYLRMSFGSADDNHLVLPQLAKHQGEFRFYPNGTVRVYDYGSFTANATFVFSAVLTNPIRVVGHYELHDGQVIIFGSPEFARFTFNQVFDLALSMTESDTLWTADDVADL